MRFLFGIGALLFLWAFVLSMKLEFGFTGALLLLFVGIGGNDG